MTLVCTDGGGIEIVPPPSGWTPVDRREPPPLGTVMLAVALGQILTAVVALLGLLAAAAASPGEGVAVAAAAAGFPLALLVWSWSTSGLLVALCAVSVRFSTIVYALAIGIVVAGAAVLALGLALGDDPPLVPFALVSSALYVTGPAALIQRFRAQRPDWLALAGLALIAVGAVATGAAAADAIG